MRAGRPFAANTGTLDPAVFPGVQYPNVYAWRAGQAATSLLSRGLSLGLGATATLLDGQSAIENFVNENNSQGTLDSISSVSGLVLMVGSSAATPLAVEGLVVSKALPGFQMMAVCAPDALATYMAVGP